MERGTKKKLRTHFIPHPLLLERDSSKCEGVANMNKKKAKWLPNNRRQKGPTLKKKANHYKSNEVLFTGYLFVQRENNANEHLII